MKNIYEVMDEFELATNKQERMEVIGKNLSKTLTEVLMYTFHPDYQWHFKEMPDGYKPKDVPAGMSYLQLSTEMRKLYLFRKGDPTSEKLTEHKRTQLLLELLENLEPRESEVVMGIFNKDLSVKGLNYKFVKEAFPNLIP
jgi:hypothetical protein